MWFWRFFILCILMCMLMLEIKLFSVELFICFLLFIVLINIVVFFIFLVKLLMLWLKDLGIILIDFGFSIIFKWEMLKNIFKKEVIRSIICDSNLVMGKVNLIRDNILLNIFIVFIIIDFLVWLLNFFMVFYNKFMNVLIFVGNLFSFLIIFCIIFFIVYLWDL